MAKLKFSISLDFLAGKFKEGTAYVKKALKEITEKGLSLKRFGELTKGVGKAMSDSLKKGFLNVSKGVKDMIKGFVGAQAILNGISFAFNKLKEGIGSIVAFEKANSKLAAILGTTSDKIADLRRNAKKLGATTEYTASQVTDLQTELAKLGFGKTQILDMTKGVLKFAQATGAELPDAAALAGSALRMFGANATETERYVSSMAIATTKSALSFDYIKTALPTVGPVAKAFNLSIEDTLALLGKLADSGFDASSAATASRNIILNLANANGKLAKALGGNVKSLPDMIEGLKKLRDKGLDLNSTLELTDARSVAAFNTFLDGADSIGELRKAITGVEDDLTKMSDTMTDNVDGAIKGLSSAWEGFMLAFYNSKGVMKDVLDFLARGIRNITDNFKGYYELLDDKAGQTGDDKVELMGKEGKQRFREQFESKRDEYIRNGLSTDKAIEAAKGDMLATLKKEELTLKEVAREAKKDVDDYRKADKGTYADKTAYYNKKGTYPTVAEKSKVERAYIEVNGDLKLNEYKQGLLNDLAKPTTTKSGTLSTPTTTSAKISELEKVEEKYAQSLAALNAKREIEGMSVNAYNKALDDLNKSTLIDIQSSKDKSVQTSKLAANLKEAVAHPLYSQVDAELEDLQTKYNKSVADAKAMLDNKVITEEQYRKEVSNIAIQTAKSALSIEGIGHAADGFVEKLRNTAIENISAPTLGTRDKTFDYKKSDREVLGEQRDLWKAYADELEKLKAKNGELSEDLQNKLNDALSRVDNLSDAMKIAEVKEDVKNLSKEINENLYSGVKDVAMSADRMVGAWQNVGDVINNVDASEWDKLMAIWNAMIQTVDGFMSLIKTIETISELTDKLTKAKGEEAKMDTAATATKVTNKGIETTAVVTAATTQSAAETAASANSVAASNAEAAADTTAAAAKVAKAHAGIPFVGIALAAAGVAALVAMISKSSSSLPKFAGGGIFMGGTSSGDKGLARLNKGEMILNHSQQSNLFRAINSGRLGGVNIGFDKVRGSDIYLSLKNYMKSTGRKL